MRRHVLLLTTSTFILAYSAIAATAQGPMPQPDQHHPQQVTPGQEGSMAQGGMMGRGMMGGMGGRMMDGGMMILRLRS